MRMIKKSVPVAELKARLSEHLRRIKSGETVIITERGRPIGMMTPLEPAQSVNDLSDLVDSGVVRPATEPLGPDFWEADLPEDADGSLRAALLEERREGR